MKNTESYTITVYTENNLGLLNRISGIFLRRHIDIDSLNLSESEIKDVFRFTITLRTTEVWINRLVSQIDKQIGVIRTFVHTDEETVYANMALFKVKTVGAEENSPLHSLIATYQCDIMEVTSDYTVVSKQGKKEEIQELYNHLSPFGILQFISSARISVSKTEMAVSHLVGTKFGTKID